LVPLGEYVDVKSLTSQITQELERILPKNFGRKGTLYNSTWDDSRGQTGRSEYFDLTFEYTFDDNKFTDFGGNLILSADGEKMSTYSSKKNPEYSKLAKKGLKIKDKVQGTNTRFAVYPYIWDEDEQRQMKNRAKRYNNSW